MCVHSRRASLAADRDIIVGRARTRRVLRNRAVADCDCVATVGDRSVAVTVRVAANRDGANASGFRIRSQRDSCRVRRQSAECAAVGVAADCHPAHAERSRLAAHYRRLVSRSICPASNGDRVGPGRGRICAHRNRTLAFGNRSVAIAVAVAADRDRADLPSFRVRADGNPRRIGCERSEGTTVGIPADRDSACAKRSGVIAVDRGLGSGCGRSVTGGGRSGSRRSRIDTAFGSLGRTTNITFRRRIGRGDAGERERGTLRRRWRAVTFLG
jgi:hypothetical protein